jgi:hypothetical protein
MTSNFTSSEADFNVICVVSILPVKYDVTSEINEDEGDFTEEMTFINHYAITLWTMVVSLVNKPCLRNLILT